DVFLFAVSDGRYLGRLCSFASCPKGKPECSVPGCGATAFMKQHKGFVLAADALDNAVILFDRRSGTHAMAVALPSYRARVLSSLPAAPTGCTHAVHVLRSLGTTLPTE